MATKTITYLQAEGDADERFAARGAHNLLLEGEAQRQAFLGSIAGVSLVDGIKELEWPVLAEVVMPFVTLATDAWESGYGAVYIDEDAWSRWAEAMSMLIADMGKAAWTKAYEEIMKRLEAASEDIKQKMHLRLADLVPVQPEVHYAEEGNAAQRAAAAAKNKATQDRAFLKELKLGDLAGSDGRLAFYARAATAVGSHVTVSSRDAKSFMKAVRAIRNAAESKMGEDLDSEEVALAFKGMLTVDPVMPVLMNLTKTAGGPAARINLRRMAWVWSGDRPVGEAELAPLLKENFHAALACFDAVRAMVGSAADGSSLPADVGRVYSSVSTVAIRVGVLRNGDHLGPASLKELEHKMKHLRGTLEGGRYTAKSMSERCDEVVCRLQAVARNAAMHLPAGAVGGAGTATETDRLGAKPGAGAVPKHYQHEVPDAMGAINYLALKRAILQRQSEGGKGVDLDVLQIAATGTIPPSAGEDPEPQRWCALMFMMAWWPTWWIRSSAASQWRRGRPGRGCSGGQWLCSCLLARTLYPRACRASNWRKPSSGRAPRRGGASWSSATFIAW